jgi:hypothetical protein
VALAYGLPFRPGNPGRIHATQLVGQLVNGEGALQRVLVPRQPRSRVMISWIASARRTDSSPGVGRQAVPLFDAGEDGSSKTWSTLNLATR